MILTLLPSDQVFVLRSGYSQVGGLDISGALSLLQRWQLLCLRSTSK